MNDIVGLGITKLSVVDVRLVLYTHLDRTKRNDAIFEISQMKHERIQMMIFIVILVISAIGGFFLTEKLILIYEYGFLETIKKGIHFVEHKPYLVTSEGDTFTRYHNLFHFLFPIVPFFVLLFLQVAILISLGILKVPNNEESGENSENT